MEEEGVIWSAPPEGDCGAGGGGSAPPRPSSSFSRNKRRGGDSCRRLNRKGRGEEGRVGDLLCPQRRGQQDQGAAQGMEGEDREEDGEAGAGDAGIQEEEIADDAKEEG